MTDKELCVSLDEAKLLKEAGFVQDSYFVYGAWKYGMDGELIWRTCPMRRARFPHPDWIIIAAPTTDELLKELPSRLPDNYDFSIRKDSQGFDVGYEKIDDFDMFVTKFTTYNKSLPNALSALWRKVKGGK